MQPVFMSPMEREVRVASCSGWPEAERVPRHGTRPVALKPRQSGSSVNHVGVTYFLFLSMQNEFHHELV